MISIQKYFDRYVKPYLVRPKEMLDVGVITIATHIGKTPVAAFRTKPTI